MSDHRPPPLTDAEKAARELRLQYNHERYVKSIAAMRSLPRLQSTIAGAGGKTNEQVRLAEEREMERRQRMQSEADRARRKEEAAQAHQEKVDALEERQQKKRARGAKKKAKKKARRRVEGNYEECNDKGSCASEDEESVDYMGSKIQQPQRDLSRVNRKGEPELTMSMWRFVTFEVFAYFIAHLASLAICVFAPGKVPIYAHGGGLITQHRAKPQPVTHDAFDVFSKIAQGVGKNDVVPNQMSSDLVLTMLVVLTMNGCVLGFIRRVMEYLKEEEAKDKLAKAENKGEEDKANNGHTFNELRCACHDMVINSVINLALIMCVAIAATVLLQTPNQIRAVGPCIMLFSLIAALLITQAHGGFPTVVKFFGNYQVLIIIGFVCMVADANVFSAGLKTQ